MRHYQEREEKTLGDQLLLKEISEIAVDKTVTECVDEFLQPYIQKLEDYVYYSRAEKKVKYLLMKRFLFTAFNNLVEMDLEMSSKQVMDAKKKLTYVQNYYENLSFQINKPVDINYEAIFLAKQTSFMAVLREQQTKRKTSELYKQRAKQAETKMAEIKDKALKFPPSSQNHAALMSEYRKLNGSYTDYIHNMALLRDEANALSEFINNFKNEYKLKFAKVFTTLGEKLLNTIIDILDGLAYEFDNTLWEEARRSKVVKSFFENAQIQGGFSSKTYLKYYLKNISKDSKNKAHQELRKLLEYLENVSSKKIFILGNDADRIAEDRYMLEGIDRNFSVFGAVDVEKFLAEYKRREFDLLVIDYNLRNYNSIDLIKDFWRRNKKAKESTIILLLFFEPSFEDINKAGLTGVKYMLRYDTAEKYKFGKKIQEILS